MSKMVLLGSLDSWEFLDFILSSIFLMFQASENSKKIRN